MELWRPEDCAGKRPEVIGKRTLMIALILHIATFLVFYIYAVINGLFTKKETIIPIDLTVVVNENLDGVENEPPPLKNPEPEPPKPKPEPPKPKPEPKKLEPPKPLEQIVTNIVVKKEKKKEEPKKKDEPKKKKKEPPKPEKPKKTAKELREERLKKMRQSAVLNKKSVELEVKDAKKSGNGRTERKTLSNAEIMKLLNQGYRPGTKEQLATSDMQLGVSLIQMALNEKWEQVSPKVGASGMVLLSARLNSSGGLVNVRISQSCGDKLSDAAALTVAQRVLAIRNLPPEFLSKFRSETLTIRYRVQGK